jgi:low temperature requirement protein LtrA
MVGTYVTATGVFGGMIPFYQSNAKPPHSLYMIWYAIMIAEAIVVITISCCWRMLSFKKTHLMERMSLLTIIVIGEGAIGVTKTVGRIMSKGLDVEGCFLIMCIIVILVRYTYELYMSCQLTFFGIGLHLGTLLRQFPTRSLWHHPTTNMVLAPLSIPIGSCWRG